MRNFPLLLALPTAVFLFGAPAVALAHTGGPLDADGCHSDHRTGSYHCHRGAAAGYSFPDRAAMQEAVRTGTFPEKSVDEDGFFSRLWPFGKQREEEEAATPDSAAAGAAGAASGTAPAAASTPRQQEFEQRLKVLQGLYEMGLITKEEYEAKRKAVLDQL